ncbi:MAG TPA: alpha/beta fold hydrolase, partial [Candidatus Limnocylindria bacterium]|nr:alpha/beta fold hydrolase [Candidatus Limnocylindria bacterium]
MAAGIEQRRIKANGIDFNVAVSGANGSPSIFCLHGFPEGSISWRPVMEALSEARFFAPDLRGYGP